MSEWIHSKGTIKKIDMPENITTLEGQAEYLKSKGFIIDQEDYQEGYVFFYDCLQLDDGWYTYTEEEVDPEEKYEAKKLDEGTIEYEVKYYDGGGDLSDALRKAMKTLIQE